MEESVWKCVSEVFLWSFEIPQSLQQQKNSYRRKIITLHHVDSTRAYEVDTDVKVSFPLFVPVSVVRPNLVGFPRVVQTQILYLLSLELSNKRRYKNINKEAVLNTLSTATANGTATATGTVVGSSSGSGSCLTNTGHESLEGDNHLPHCKPSSHSTKQPINTITDATTATTSALSATSTKAAATSTAAAAVAVEAKGRHMIVYVIDVSYGEARWVVSYRHSDFHMFYRAIKQELRSIIQSYNSCTSTSSSSGTSSSQLNTPRTEGSSSGNSNGNTTNNNSNSNNNSSNSINDTIISVKKRISFTINNRGHFTMPSTDTATATDIATTTATANAANTAANTAVNTTVTTAANTTDTRVRHRVAKEQYIDYLKHLPTFPHKKKFFTFQSKTEMYEANKKRFERILKYVINNKAFYSKSVAAIVYSFLEIVPHLQSPELYTMGFRELVERASSSAAAAAADSNTVGNAATTADVMSGMAQTQTQGQHNVNTAAAAEPSSHHGPRTLHFAEFMAAVKENVQTKLKMPFWSNNPNPDHPSPSSNKGSGSSVHGGSGSGSAPLTPEKRSLGKSTRQPIPSDSDNDDDEDDNASVISGDTDTSQAPDPHTATATTASRIKSGATKINRFLQKFKIQNSIFSNHSSKHADESSVAAGAGSSSSSVKDRSVLLSSREKLAIKIANILNQPDEDDDDYVEDNIVLTVGGVTIGRMPTSDSERDSDNRIQATSTLSSNGRFSSDFGRISSMPSLPELPPSLSASTTDVNATRSASGTALRDIVAQLVVVPNVPVSVPVSRKSTQSNLINQQTPTTATASTDATAVVSEMQSPGSMKKKLLGMFKRSPTSATATATATAAATSSTTSKKLMFPSFKTKSPAPASAPVGSGAVTTANAAAGVNITDSDTVDSTAAAVPVSAVSDKASATKKDSPTTVATAVSALFKN